MYLGETTILEGGRGANILYVPLGINPGLDMRLRVVLTLFQLVWAYSIN